MFPRRDCDIYISRRAASLMSQKEKPTLSFAFTEGERTRRTSTLPCQTIILLGSVSSSDAHKSHPRISLLPPPENEDRFFASRTLRLNARESLFLDLPLSSPFARSHEKCSSDSSRSERTLFRNTMQNRRLNYLINVPLWQLPGR